MPFRSLFDALRTGLKTPGSEDEEFDPREISDKRRDEIIDFLADQTTRRGLNTPAALFLEMYKPLSYVTSQAVHFLAPIPDTVLGNNLVSEMGIFLEDRDNMTRLVNRIAEMAKDQDREIAEFRRSQREPKSDSSGTAGDSEPVSQPEADDPGPDR